MNIKNGLIIILSIFVLQSCIKKEQKVTEEAKVIQLLNQSDADAALVKINALLKSDPNNENLLYLKASAISMIAGIDVYRLFPILKAKIFDVAITQWADKRESMRERRALTKADLVYTPLDPNAILYEFERADASSADGINAVIKFIVRTNDIGGDTKENSGIFILEYATSTSDRLWEIFGEESKEITKDDSRALEFKEIIGTLIELKHLEEWNKRPVFLSGGC